MSLRRVPFIVLVFAITLVGVPIGVIWPTVRQMQTTSQAIYHEYQFLEERHRRGQDIRRARADYDELKVHWGALRAVAIEPGDELAFITAVEEVADSSAVTTTLKLDLKGGKTRAGYVAIPIEINVRGTYIDVLRYLAALRALPLATAFSAVTITQAKAARGPQPTGEATAVEARLTGSIYQHVTPRPLIP
jgi:Tfp pilus assembly protein PilO